MMNIIIAKNEVVPFYEFIGHEEPTTIKGAYYVYGGSKEKTVDCVVYDPSNEIIYKRTKSPQGIIMFDSTTPGEYAFVFSNFDNIKEVVITLALHTFEE